MINKTKTRGFEFISEEQQIKDSVTPTKLPKRATALSAGYDCFTPIDITLQPGEDIKVATGIKSYMLEDEYLCALPRSGHGFKFYLRLANTKGIIDADYYNNSGNEGHIWVKIRNEGKDPVTIKSGEGMCQLIFQKYLIADGDSFSGEERTGGFGSTTTK